MNPPLMENEEGQRNFNPVRPQAEIAVTILVVDDNDAGRYATSRILRHAGYTVTEARTGEEALAAVEAGLDLVVLDVKLPDLSGFEVCRRLKMNPATATIPVLHLSAHHRDSLSHVIGLEGGADGYLTKPVEPEVLVATIRTHLRIRQMERQQQMLIAQLKEDQVRSQQLLEELRISQARLNIALQNAPMLVYTTDTELRYTWMMNPTHGFTVEDVLGKRDDELLPQEDVAELMAFKQQVLATGVGARQEVSFVIDGETRIYDVKAEALRSGDGAITGLTVAALDTTERKHQEEIRERYRALVQASSDAVISMSPAGAIQTWSPAAMRIYGYREEEILGQNAEINLLVPPELQQERKMLFARVCEGEAIEAYETERLTKDGQRVVIELSLAPIRDADGAVIGLSAVHRDVTAHKQVQRDLREQQEFLTRVIESSQDCIKVLDLQGYLLSMNSGGQRLLEVEDLTPLLNTCWLDLWQGDDHHAATEAVQAARAGGTGTFIGFCPTQRGAPKWWDVVITPMLGADDKPEQLLVVSRDVTDNRRLAEEHQRRELEHQVEQRVLDERRHLAQELHDGLKQHLAGIQMLTASLQKRLARYGLPEAKIAKELVGYLAEANTQMRSLMEDLAPVKVTAEQFMPTLKRGARAIRQWYGIPCRFSVDGTLLKCDEVANHLYHITREAVTNAAKHSKASEIRVTLHHQDGMLVLQVRDDGVGLPQDAHQRGGMGLSSIQQRAKLLEATLEFHSPPEGGTVVTCILPLLRA